MMSRVIVTGRLPSIPDTGSHVRYVAASPADRSGSFSGSGFPFANEMQAFESTPNVGELDVKVDGSYTVELISPNSFYRGLGTTLVPPTLFIQYTNQGILENVETVVGKSIPFRTLTYPGSRHDASFYDDSTRPERDVRSQERILLDSRYPRVQPDDFWGDVTPQ